MSQQREISVWIIEDVHEYRQELSRKLNATEGICCAHDFGSFEEALPFFRLDELPQVVLGRYPASGNERALKSSRNSRADIPASTSLC